MGLVRARDSALGKVAAIGTVNPRPGGLVNSLVQAWKRLVARVLDWHVREQVEFNRQVLGCVDAAIEALNEDNRALVELGSRGSGGCGGARESPDRAGKPRPRHPGGSGEPRTGYFGGSGNARPGYPGSQEGLRQDISIVREVQGPWAGTGGHPQALGRVAGRMGTQAGPERDPVPAQRGRSARRFSAPHHPDGHQLPRDGSRAARRFHRRAGAQHGRDSEDIWATRNSVWIWSA